MLAWIGADDPLVDPIRGVVGTLVQQEHLNKGVVLERDALLDPFLGDPDNLREQPRLVLEVALRDPPGDEEHDLLFPPGLEIVERVDICRSDDRRKLRLGRYILG